MNLSPRSGGIEEPMKIVNSAIDKKENRIFLIYREIQTGAVEKSCMTNGLLKY
jgi:hypothetical protein